MKVHSYTIHIEPASEGGYWSRVPALPGCYSQGETLEETIEHTKEAIELYLEGLKSNKEEIPEESEGTMSLRVPVSL